MILINYNISNFITNIITYSSLFICILALYIYLTNIYYDVLNKNQDVTEVNKLEPTDKENNTNPPRLPEDPISKILRKWRQFKKRFKEHMDVYGESYMNVVAIMFAIICFFIITEAIVKFFDQEDYVCTIVRNIIGELDRLPLAVKASLIAIKDSCPTDFFFFHRFVNASTALDGRSKAIQTKFLIEVIFIYVDQWNLYEDPRRHALFLRMVMDYCSKYGLNYTAHDLTLLIDNINKLNDLINGVN